MARKDNQYQAREWVLKCRTCNYCYRGTLCNADHRQAPLTSRMEESLENGCPECPYFQQRRHGVLYRFFQGLGIL